MDRPTLDGRINLRKLEIFCLVVELGSVSEAARQLHLVQPAVSEHIRSLERHVGCKLIVRRGRGFEVTEAGTRLNAWAEETLGRARELGRELDGLKSGEQGSAEMGASLTVGTYLLPPIIAEFAATRPEAQIALRTSIGGSAVEGVLDGSLDFAVVVGQRPATTEITTVPLTIEPFVLVAPPALDLPGRLPVTALEEVPFVCMVDDAVRRNLIDTPLRQLGLGPRNVALQLGHPEGIKRTVESGVGVAFLLRAAVERELEAGSLREVEVDVNLAGQIALVHRTGRAFSPLQERLMEAIAADVGERGRRLGASAKAAATT